MATEVTLTKTLQVEDLSIGPEDPQLKKRIAKILEYLNKIPGLYISDVLFYKNYSEFECEFEANIFFLYDGDHVLDSLFLIMDYLGIYSPITVHEPRHAKISINNDTVVSSLDDVIERINRGWPYDGEYTQFGD